MDFQDFFPSILADDFVLYLLANEILAEEKEAKLLSRIFFKNDAGKLRLSIGSPGSPMISNALLYNFDERVSSICKNSDVAYTRYSDDMTFTTNQPNILFEWPKKIDAFLNEMESPILTVNAKKTVFSSKKFNRHVTGITITNDGRPSIGRGRKRALRTRVFKVANLDSDEVVKLRGHIAFAAQVEPAFLEALWQKYPEQMKIIMRS